MPNPLTPCQRPLVFVALFCLGAGVLFLAGVVGAGRAAYLNMILFRSAMGRPAPGDYPTDLSMPSAAPKQVAISRAAGDAQRLARIADDWLRPVRGTR